VNAWFEKPNVLWMREMRQAVRLERTPWILFAITLVMTMLMCTIGGLAGSSSAAPHTIGATLFQTFFSLAFFVVVLVGPAMAANGIASEREGRTWEAVMLTALSAKEIARGKFLAAYTTIALYIVVLAPVGALAFVFGGVTATEVFVAFVFLFLIAGLAVAFGLAISSLMSSQRGALVVTLIAAVVGGVFVYSTFGVGLSELVSRLWPEVPRGSPVWLPVAYSRAPFGLDYAVLLVLIPVVCTVLPAWFLYEVTVANLSAPADDRTTGLKRWLVVSAPVFAVCCAAPSALAQGTSDRLALSIAGMATFSGFFAFAALLFVFDAAGPSRRVRVQWERAGAGAVRRFFGPGLARSGLVVLALGALGIALIVGLDVALLHMSDVANGNDTDETAVKRMLFFAAYAAPFGCFVVGLCTYVRSRTRGPWIARLVACGILFLVCAAPWVVAAVAGAVTHTSGEGTWMALGAPSPFYVIVMIQGASAAEPFLTNVGFGAAGAWTVIGLALLRAGARRSQRMLEEREQAEAEAGRRLEEEEQLRAAGLAPAEGAPYR